MLELDQLHHRPGGGSAVALDHLSLANAEQALLLGPSGSGKTTLLSIAAGLIKPERGTARIDDIDPSSLSPSDRDRWRGRNVGIVFQRLHLIPSLTVRQNLRVAQYCAQLPQDMAQVDSTLAALGLADKAGRKPGQLSGGEAQRVAIARAVVNRPRLILADEPTASLDDANAARVLDLLLAQAEACKAMLLIATHDARVVARIARRIALPAQRLEGASS